MRSGSSLCMRCNNYRPRGAIHCDECGCCVLEVRGRTAHAGGRSYGERFTCGFTGRTRRQRGAACRRCLVCPSPPSTRRGFHHHAFTSPPRASSRPSPRSLVGPPLPLDGQMHRKEEHPFLLLVLEWPLRPHPIRCRRNRCVRHPRRRVGGGGSVTKALDHHHRAQRHVGGAHDRVAQAANPRQAVPVQLV